MIKVILLCLFVGILIAIILLLVVKVIKLRRIINKRINGKELTLGDLRKFNTWSFSSFGIDERIDPNRDKVYVVYQFIGLFGDKFDFSTHDNFSDAVKDYASRTRNEIDKIIYNQYSNKKVKKIY